jgi:hypothetical protein
MRFQISHVPSGCRRSTLTCHDRWVRGALSTLLVVTTNVSEPDAIDMRRIITRASRRVP